MCTSPITIRTNSIDGTTSMQVPCGKCAECLKTKQNDYMVRIYEELTQSSKAVFLTLTYSNENVPYFMRDGVKYLTVWKKDVKDWIKRFRTNYDRATGIKGIRYFLCSEYGPKTHRPHYHAIFFNLSRVDMKIALADWSERFGFVMAKDIDFSDTKSLMNSARYLSKYCTKGVFESPFCKKADSLTNLPPVFKESWCDICESHAVLPRLFILSDGIDLRSFAFRLSKFDYKIYRQILGRCIVSEKRFSWNI